MSVCMCASFPFDFVGGIVGFDCISSRSFPIFYFMWAKFKEKCFICTVSCIENSSTREKCFICTVSCIENSSTRE